MAEKSKINKKRVVIYARISPNVESDKLQIQIDDCKKYIESNSDWELTDIYTDCCSGRKKIRNRAGFKRLLYDCQNKKIDKIVAVSYHAISRDLEDFIWLMGMLMGFGTSISFYEQNSNEKTITITYISKSCGQALRDAAEGSEKIVKCASN